MAVGWAWAFDTPYKWTKQVPSFFGGTRQGMAISWPAKIKDKGGIRWQFHHVIDIVPTLLEATGIPAPVMVDGIAQKPIEGVSMAYTFDKANADAPSPHRTQYFEMLGVQGLYNDGWMLSAVPDARAMGTARQGHPRPGQRLQVRALRRAATTGRSTPTSPRQNPGKLQGDEGPDVRPSSPSIRCCRSMPRWRRGWLRRGHQCPAGRKVFIYSGEPVTGIPRGTAPSVLNTSYTITARDRGATGRR